MTLVEVERQLRALGTQHVHVQYLGATWIVTVVGAKRAVGYGLNLASAVEMALLSLTPETPSAKGIS